MFQPELHNYLDVDAENSLNSMPRDAFTLWSTMEQAFGTCNRDRNTHTKWHVVSPSKLFLRIFLTLMRVFYFEILSFKKCLKFSRLISFKFHDFSLKWFQLTVISSLTSHRELNAMLRNSWTAKSAHRLYSHTKKYTQRVTCTSFDCWFSVAHKPSTYNTEFSCSGHIEQHLKRQNVSGRST